MLHIKDAEAQGFTVDSYAAGRPYAYKGERFAPTEAVECYTELETKLLTANFVYVVCRGEQHEGQTPAAVFSNPLKAARFIRQQWPEAIQEKDSKVIWLDGIVDVIRIQRMVVE